MSRDPTTVELISLGDLPIIMLFLPREESFETRLRILHELEQYQSEWVMWTLLVTKIADLGVHKEADDIHFLRMLLADVPLPPGVPEKFRDLDVCRGHTHMIKERGYNHNHLIASYHEGERSRPLHGYLRFLEKAKRFPTIRLLEETAVPDVSEETPHSLMTAIERRWDGFLYHFFKEVMCPVLKSGFFARLQTWSDVAVHFLGENLPRLGVTPKRVEIKYRPDQANNIGVRCALRLAAHNNKLNEQEVARLRSDDVGIKAEELNIVLERLKDFAYATTPVDPFDAPPLHPHTKRQKRLPRLPAADQFKDARTAFETSASRNADIYSGYAYFLANRMTPDAFIRWADALGE
jgi:hypothetical protein